MERTDNLMLARLCCCFLSENIPPPPPPRPPQHINCTEIVARIHVHNQITCPLIQLYLFLSLALSSRLSQALTLSSSCSPVRGAWEFAKPSPEIAGATGLWPFSPPVSTSLVNLSLSADRRQGSAGRPQCLPLPVRTPVESAS